MTSHKDHSPDAPHQVLALRSISSTTADPDPDPAVPRWVAAAEQRTTVLSARRLRVTLRYLSDPWYRVPRAVVWWVGKGVAGGIAEVVPVIRGAGTVADSIARFGYAVDHEEGVRLAVGTKDQYRAKERHCNVKARRRFLLFTGGAGAVAVGVWCYYYHPTAGLVALLVIIAILDIIGHVSQEKTEAPPAKPRPLVEGMPTRQLRTEIVVILGEEGYDELITVSDVIFDVERHEYHVNVVTHTDIKPELLRHIERRINAPLNAIRTVVDPQDSACRTLVIRTGNPLEKVPEAPWIVSGSRSGWSKADLGLSSNPETPYEVMLVKTHILIVAMTGGGKTTVHINNIIDRLAATSDVIICAGALVKVADFVAWRSVIHRLAQTVEEMDDLLQWALDEIARRDQLLKDIAADDDPTNDLDSWDPALGPAIVIILDEFPEIAEYNGTGAHKDDPNLLEKAKRIMRTGRGLALTLILGVQASGNQDWGSSVMSKQIQLTIIGPVSEDDTVAILGKNKRDQGYAPHLLRAAVDADNFYDAGMAVIDGPGFGADYVRGYKPFHVKARAMRREAEWQEMGNRPQLDSSPALSLVINAETVPNALAAVDAALKHYNARILSSALVVQHANEHGGHWTPTSLSRELEKETEIRPHKDGWSHNGRCDVNKKVLKCYHRKDIDDAFQAREEGFE